jgi:hypothetical protein
MNEFDEIINDVIFIPKPIPVPFRSRISFCVAQITLILEINSSKNSCSDIKIHTITSALNNKKDFDDLLEYCKNSSIYIRFTPKLDPCVTKAIRFALKDNICNKFRNGNYKLTDKGKIFAKSIISRGLMTNDIEALEKLGTLLTDKLIKSLIKGRQVC